MNQRMGNNYGHGCRRVVHFLAAWTCISLTLASSQVPLLDNRRSSKTTSRRVDTDVAACEQNLLEATSMHGFMFTQDAYLDFIQKQSNGAIVKKSFDSSILDLAHEYWVVSCTVSNGDCTGGETVTAQEIIDFKEQDGSDLLSDFCARIDGILDEKVTPVPTARPTKSPTPVLADPTPTKSPTKGPSPIPSTKSPTKDPSPAPTKSPTKGPTLAPAPLSSEPPTSIPSPSPTLELFDLSDCDAYSQVWRFEQITAAKCTTAQSLIQEGRINCNSECPPDCQVCSLCLAQNIDCSDPTVSPAPSFSPTSRDQFTLTFSVGYDIDNAEDVVVMWAERVVYEELQLIDPGCTTETKSSCPIMTNVVAVLNVRDCDLFIPAIEDAEECALADLSVAISSTDAFEGEIIAAIESRIRARIGDELEDLLSTSGFNFVQQVL